MRLLGQVAAELGHDRRRGARRWPARRGRAGGGRARRRRGRWPSSTGRRRSTGRTACARSWGRRGRRRPKRWPAEREVDDRAPARRRAAAAASRLTSTKWPRWLVPNCVSKPSAVVPCGQAMTPALAISTSRRSCVGEHAVGERPHRRERRPGRASRSSTSPGRRRPRPSAFVGLGRGRGRRRRPCAPWAASGPGGLDAEAGRRAGDEHVACR